MAGWFKGERVLGRMLRGVVGAVVLGVVASVGVVASPAQAADPSWWFSGLKVADAHAAGFTGKGVKIALIDSQIDPSSPSLAGANVTVNTDYVCKESSGKVHEDANTSAHATGVAQMLVRPGGVLGLPTGIAPDAQITAYVRGDNKLCGSSISRGANGEVVSVWASVIDRAVGDGADIISVSLSTAAEPEAVAALTRALAAGVIVVAAVMNTIEQRDNKFPNGANGVVSVTAVSDAGDLQVDSGETVSDPDVTVAAPGIGITLISGDSASPTTRTTTGTSLATPLVAGALALAKQKFPKATGNQLIQALIHSTASAQKGLPRDTSGGYGYGMLSLSGLLASDVMSFPDVNPLMDKKSGRGQPTMAEVEAAKNGKGTSAPQPSAPVPAPSASDSTPTPSASVPASAAGSETNVVPYIAGGVVAALGVGILVFVIVWYRRSGSSTKS